MTQMEGRSESVSEASLGPIRIGTRGSRLALAQANNVAAALRVATGREVRVISAVTHGDVSRASLAAIGGVGVFATRLRTGLASGEFDVLVHSCKDLPTQQPAGFALAALPARADARDVLCARGGPDGARFSALPAGARVGTGSTRRAAQVRRARPDVQVVDMRGNVDTRLSRLDDDLDAVVLAAAGLDRLGRLGAATEWLDADEWVAAPAQGALAVETRVGQEWLAAPLDDAATRLAVQTERAVLAGLGAGCAAPVGVHARLVGGALSVEACVYAIDPVGDARVSWQVELQDVAAVLRAGARSLDERAAGFGRVVCDELVERGADRIVAEATRP